jgi:hypothetical protein
MMGTSGTVGVYRVVWEPSRHREVDGHLPLPLPLPLPLLLILIL